MTRRMSNDNLVYMYSEKIDHQATQQFSFIGYVGIVSFVVAISCGAAVYTLLTVLFYIIILVAYGDYPSQLEIEYVMMPVREMCALFSGSTIFVVMVILQNEKWNRLVTVFEERGYKDTGALDYAESPVAVKPVLEERRSATSRTYRYCEFKFSESEWQRFALYLDDNNWQLGSRDSVATIKNDNGGVLFTNITKQWKYLQGKLKRCGMVDDDNYVTDSGKEWLGKFLPAPSDD